MRAPVLLILTSLAMSACAPSHEGKSPGYRPSLVKSLNARGIPDASWTESDLNAYEADLMRLEQTDGGTNHALIQSRREALDDARAKKLAKALSFQTKRAQETAATGLIVERDGLVRDVNADGNPDVSWTTDKLLALKHKLARIDELGRKIQAYLGRCVINYDEFTRVVRVSVNRALQERAPVMQPIRQVKGSPIN